MYAKARIVAKEKLKEMQGKGKKMVRQEFLRKEGTGRYRMCFLVDFKDKEESFDDSVVSSDDSVVSSDDSVVSFDDSVVSFDDSVVSSDDSGGNSQHSGGNSQHSGGNSQHSGGNSQHSAEDITQLLNDIAGEVASHKRVSRDLMKATIIKLCLVKPFTLRELAGLLARDPISLSNNYLRQMLKTEELFLLYPEKLNHPAQAYYAKNEG